MKKRRTKQREGSCLVRDKRPFRSLHPLKMYDHRSQPHSGERLKVRSRDGALSKGICFSNKSLIKLSRKDNVLFSELKRIGSNNPTMFK
jgi:hypothetical protein